ncbi:NTP transferase domain-containing protein [Corynebacterium sp. MSK218]|uniref:molybdenum cofactor guanylyltransferase n=1 Tax=Corynebacterium sp. MSK218 TaxID=3050218 RepID=UPI00254D5C70|nr:NTP transferase domain-containing protein [Corynebacterium sp. MSK218]MDK8763867.1 NTP transferase domain-containing protein [Corynebacterium sp. MSK218]
MLASTAPFAAIIVAGGRGSRMGGADKASIRVGGQRLLDRLHSYLPYGTPSVVVSPHWLGSPQVCESPLYGGPAAGIAAGYRFLAAKNSATHGQRDLVAVVAVDAPESPLAIPKLIDGLGEHSVAVAATGKQIQPLCAVWRVDALGGALSRLGGVHNRSARSLLRAADSIAIVQVGEEIRDYDTPQELRAYEQRITGSA